MALKFVRKERVRMISIKKIKQIITEVLENNTGKVSISLNHNLKDDLLLDDDDTIKVAEELLDAFCEIDCFMELDYPLWNTVADICNNVVDSLEEEGYVIYQNEDV